MSHKSKKYNRGIIHRTPNGKYQAEINHQYRLLRKSFPTEAQARAWIDIAII